MVKILFTATVVKKHIMEFHIPFLKMCKDMGWETAVAARNDYENIEDCKIPYCDQYYDIPFDRNPTGRENRLAYNQLKKVIDDGDFDLIHCNTPVGAALTRLAARDARKKGTKVIYMAHGFHFYKGAPLRNWILYYPVERNLAKDTDVLITINHEDYEAALRFPKVRTVYLPGVGIDLEKFKPREDIRKGKRRELGIQDDEFMILSIGELIKRKNHKTVLEAVKILKEKNKNMHLRYVICGSGSLKKAYQTYIRDNNLQDSVILLGYRNDVREIYNAADFFAFMSYQEGLPVALMEAMSSGLPCIATKIRGNTDLIQDGKNGFLIENNAKILADKIQMLIEHPEIRESISQEARISMKAFELNTVLEKLKQIYLDTLSS